MAKHEWLFCKSSLGGLQEQSKCFIIILLKPAETTLVKCQFFDVLFYTIKTNVILKNTKCTYFYLLRFHLVNGLKISPHIFCIASCFHYLCPRIGFG